ncbi:MAG: hypothetical protein WC008_04800 [Bacilli bacterium]
MAHVKLTEIDKLVNLSFNEVVLKTYEAFELIDPSGSGVFSVTNKRLIFVAAGSSSITSSTSITEWMIDDIKGIQSEHGKRRHKRQTAIANILGIITGLAAILVAMMFFSGREVLNYYYIGVGVLFLTFIILKLTAKRKMFSLSIFGGTTTPIVNFSSSFYKSAITNQIQIKPSKYTSTMIRDLGSTILNAKGK